MLQPYVQVLLSGTLSLGVPLALAVRELVLLRRGDGGAPRSGDPTPPPLSPAPEARPPRPSPRPRTTTPRCRRSRPACARPCATARSPQRTAAGFASTPERARRRRRS